MTVPPGSEVRDLASARHALFVRRCPLTHPFSFYHCLCAVAPFCSPALEEGEAVLYAALTRGLSFKMTMGNIVTLVPPLIVTQEQMDTAIDILDDALTEVEAAFGYA